MTISSINRFNSTEQRNLSSDSSTKLPYTDEQTTKSDESVFGAKKDLKNLLQENGYSVNQKAFKSTATETTKDSLLSLGGASTSQEQVYTITENEKKDLIKSYREMGYSRKEAKKLFESNTTTIEKMSRKEAKKWVKEYMANTGCTKKKAKEAFQKEFGYSMPLSELQKFRRTLALANPVGVIADFIDRATGGKLGIKKFTTGEGNNDAKYVTQ